MVTWETNWEMEIGDDRQLRGQFQYAYFDIYDFDVWVGFILCFFPTRNLIKISEILFKFI